MIIMNSIEISKYRTKLCLFFIATVFYGAFVSVDLLFGGIIVPKPIKDIFINSITWIIFFIPYLFLLYEVIKNISTIKRIFYVDNEHKIRDIIQIVLIALWFLPFVFFTISIMYWLTSWIPLVLRSL